MARDLNPICIHRPLYLERSFSVNHLANSSVLLQRKEPLGVIIFISCGSGFCRTTRMQAHWWFFTEIQFSCCQKSRLKPLYDPKGILPSLSSTLMPIQLHPVHSWSRSITESRYSFFDDVFTNNSRSLLVVWIRPCISFFCVMSRNIT